MQCIFFKRYIYFILQTLTIIFVCVCVGFLVALLTLRALTQRKFSLVQYYVHRYLRLTPVLLFWIMVYWKLLPVLGKGPMWPRLIDNSSVNCDKW